MNIVLWVLQVVLGVLFVFHGRVMVSPPPREKLRKGMAYVRDIPTGFARVIGVAEALGGIGLILPGLTGILPWLTPLAAAGLVVVMVGAVVYHIPRGEYRATIFNLVLLVLAGFVAYTRWTELPL